MLLKMSLVKNLASIGGAKILVILCGTIYTLAALSLFGLENYGRYTFWVGLAYTINFLFSYKYENTLFKERKVYKEALGKLLIQAAIKVALFTMIIVFIHHILDSYTKVYDYLIILLISFFSGINVLLVQAINIDKGVRSATIPLIFQSVSYIVLGLPVLYLFMERGYYVGILIVNAVPSVISFFMLEIREWKTERRLFSIKLLSVGLIKSGYQDVIPIALKTASLHELIGLYSLATKFIKVPGNLLLSSLVMMSLDESNKFSINQAKWTSSFWFFTVLLVMMLIAAFLYPTMYQASIITPWVIIDVLFLIQYVDLIKYENTSIFIARTLFLTTLLLVIFLIKEQSVERISIVLLILAVLQYFTHMILSQKWIRRMQ